MKTLARNLSFLLALWLPLAVPGQEAPKPGPQHQKLKESEGGWVATIKMGDQGSPGKAVMRMDFDGFYLVEEFDGEFMGMKFRGRGQTGYCPIRKKYVSYWTDNMSATPVILEGDFDASGKELTLVGEGPGMDGKMAKFKTVTRYVDADTHVFTLHQVGADGVATPMMSIEYKRQK